MDFIIGVSVGFFLLCAVIQLRAAWKIWQSMPSEKRPKFR